MFQRYLQNRLPETSFFLFGPRQVGKSTLLRNEKPHLKIDLLDPELQLSYNKNPNLLRLQLDDLPPDGVNKILIDEVQRVPKLLDVVHALMEQGLIFDLSYAVLPPGNCVTALLTSWEGGPYIVQCTL